MTSFPEQVNNGPVIVSLLKVLLAAKSEQHHVAARLVASSDDIDRLALDENPDIPALHGWRREVFGDDALLLKQGRIALGVDDTERARRAIEGATGKRITYRQPHGETPSWPTPNA